MAEKLKSILRRISWSSVLKAVVFAVAWWALPFWIFVPVALYLYFIPIAGTGTVSVPFLVLLLLSFLETPGAFLAVVLGLVFYFILLIKDLLIIDRRMAYEMLMLVLTYLMLRGFFLHLGGAGFGGWSLLEGAIVAGVLAVLLLSFTNNFLPIDPEGRVPEERQFLRVTGWISFMLIWQFLIVGLFLPLDFLYQSATIFLAIAAFMDLVSQYIFGELSRNKALAALMVVFGFLVLVFTSARWGL